MEGPHGQEPRGARLSPQGPGLPRKDPVPHGGPAGTFWNPRELRAGQWVRAQTLTHVLTRDWASALAWPPRGPALPAQRPRLPGQRPGAKGDRAGPGSGGSGRGLHHMVRALPAPRSVPCARWLLRPGGSGGHSGHRALWWRPALWRVGERRGPCVGGSRFPQVTLTSQALPRPPSGGFESAGTALGLASDPLATGSTPWAAGTGPPRGPVSPAPQTSVGRCSWERPQVACEHRDLLAGLARCPGPGPTAGWGGGGGWGKVPPSTWWFAHQGVPIPWPRLLSRAQGGPCPARPGRAPPRRPLPGSRSGPPPADRWGRDSGGPCRGGAGAARLVCPGGGCWRGLPVPMGRGCRPGERRPQRLLDAGACVALTCPPAFPSRRRAKSCWRRSCRSGNRPAPTPTRSRTAPCSCCSSWPAATAPSCPAPCPPPSPAWSSPTPSRGPSPCRCPPSWPRSWG